MSDVKKNQPILFPAKTLIFAYTPGDGDPRGKFYNVMEDGTYSECSADLKVTAKVEGGRLSIETAEYAKPRKKVNTP